MKDVPVNYINFGDVDQRITKYLQGVGGPTSEEVPIRLFEKMALMLEGSCAMP